MLPVSKSKLEQIAKEQKRDNICAQLMDRCKKGWPRQEELPQRIKPYWVHQGELYMAKGLLMKGQRIVIPESLQREMLARIHEGHMGISKCRARAQQAVWWLGLSNQISEVISQCEIYLRKQPQRSEPMIPSILPEHPRQKVGTDLFFRENMTYLVTVDYYSRWTEVEKIPITSAKGVTSALKAIFSINAMPELLISNNGPQFASSEFASFAADYDFSHVTSSPYFSQSNGEAARAVQTVKALLKKNDDPYRALLEYRVIPLLHGPSPAELDSPLPQVAAQLLPHWPNKEAFKQKDEILKSTQIQNCNRRHRSTDRLELIP